MNDTSTGGPRTQKAAAAMVAKHLLHYMNAKDIDAMFSTAGWTDAQLKRTEAALKDVAARLTRLAG